MINEIPFAFRYYYLVDYYINEYLSKLTRCRNIVLKCKNRILKNFLENMNEKFENKK